MTIGKRSSADGGCGLGFLLDAMNGFDKTIQFVSWCHFHANPDQFLGCIGEIGGGLQVKMFLCYPGGVLSKLPVEIVIPLGISLVSSKYPRWE